MAVSRIASLDALRGLAALGVAVFHYVWLAPAGTRPFEHGLGWLYEFGRLAVPLFYLLSGYIFFAAYARPIGEGAVTGRDFFWLRASRLYPLHVLTLCVVACLQPFAFDASGGHFSYRYSDLRHFALNLAFVQFSWVDSVMTYNGPSWSLAIEAGLYVVFFAFARAFGPALWPRLGFGALCLALSSLRQWLPISGPLNVFFAEGLGCFFLGGCIQATQNWRDPWKLALGLATLALGVGLFHLTGGLRETTPPLFAGVALIALAAPPLSRVSALPPFVWLGEISYSIYLWHLPVQIVLALISAAAGPLPFSSPWMLALYVAATLCVATLSYRGFEVPARGWMRRWAALGQRAPA